MAENGDQTLQLSRCETTVGLVYRRSGEKNSDSKEAELAPQELDKGLGTWMRDEEGVGNLPRSLAWVVMLVKQEVGVSLQEAECVLTRLWATSWRCW